MHHVPWYDTTMILFFTLSLFWTIIMSSIANPNQLDDITMFLSLCTAPLKYRTLEILLCHSTKTPNQYYLIHWSFCYVRWIWVHGTIPLVSGLSWSIILFVYKKNVFLLRKRSYIRWTDPIFKTLYFRYHVCFIIIFYIFFSFKIWAAIFSHLIRWYTQFRIAIPSSWCG